MRTRSESKRVVPELSRCYLLTAYTTIRAVSDHFWFSTSASAQLQKLRPGLSYLGPLGLRITSRWLVTTFWTSYAMADDDVSLSSLLLCCLIHLILQLLAALWTFSKWID